MSSKKSPIVPDLESKDIEFVPEEEDLGEDHGKIEYLIDTEAENEEEENVDDQAQEVFVEHREAVYCVSFSPKTLSNGCVAFASGGGDDIAVLYHISGNQPPVTFKLTSHTDSINVVSFSPDGTILATGGLDGKVCTWDTTNGALICDLAGPTDSIEWVNWHPTIPALLAGDRAGMIWLWNGKTGKCVKVFSCHGGAVTCGGFRANGAEIWSAGEDSTLKIWSPRTGQSTSTVHGLEFHGDPITAGHSNQNLIVTGDITGIVHITRFDDSKVLGQSDTGEHSIEAIQFSPDGKWFAVASMGGTLSIWDPNTFKSRHALVHPDGVTCFKWHPTRPFVISGCSDGNVRIWDIRNGSLLSTLTGHEDVITSIDIHLVEGSQSDLLIVTASDDATVRMFSFIEEYAQQSSK